MASNKASKPEPRLIVDCDPSATMSEPAWFVVDSVTGYTFAPRYMTQAEATAAAEQAESTPSVASCRCAVPDRMAETPDDRSWCAYCGGVIPATPREPRSTCPGCGRHVNLHRVAGGAALCDECAGVNPRTGLSYAESTTERMPAMALKTTRKVATVADIVAAAALGTLDPTTPMVTAEAAESMARKAAAAAEAERPAIIAPATDRPMATDHECAIPGCRHGAAHGAAVQPDRQVKLQCPTCGAVARMTAGAIRKAGGTPTCADGTPMAEAARRTYSRRVA